MGLERRARLNRAARHHLGRERLEHRIGRNRREALGRAVERERLALAQIDQAGDLVDLGAGEHHGRDRAVAQSLARLEYVGPSSPDENHPDESQPAAAPPVPGFVAPGKVEYASPEIPASVAAFELSRAGDRMQ